MDLTPKQQTSEAIRQAETILVITGQHPSVDQASAVVALAGILRKFGKNVTAIISDNPPAATQMLDTSAYERALGGARDFVLKVDVTKAEVDKLRYEVEDGKLNVYLTPFKGSFAPSDVTFGYGEFHFDLAIVLGVPTRARIDRIYEQNSGSFATIPVINLDFHRSNENYGAVNLIEPNASSLCEMLVALSESLQGGIIDADIATALLMGLVGSTDRFTAAHTSPKSLTVAAQMMAAGAKQQAVVKALYRGNADRGADGRNNNDRPSSGGDGRNANNERSGNSGRQQASGQPQRADQAQRSDQRNEQKAEPRQSAEQPARSERPAEAAPRTEASRQNGPRTEAVRPQPAEPVVPVQPIMPAEVAQAMPSPVAPAPVAQVQQVQPVAPAPAPVMPQEEALTALKADEIIQPSHIELMTAAAVESPAPIAPVAPIAPAPTQTLAPEIGSAAVAEAPAMAPSQPQNLPAADFAAAAEMFNRTIPAEQAGQGQSGS